LTQEFLSQMLGVRRTTVTLVARQLEQAGLNRGWEDQLKRVEIALFHHLSIYLQIRPSSSARDEPSCSLSHSTYGYDDRESGFG
jgi:hypothetical protein